MTAICTSCRISTELITNKTICRTKQSINKLRGFLKRLVSNAIKKRKENKCIFEISYQDVLNLWNNQLGLCYYSKIPMIVHQKSDWKCSLEKKNPSVGYVINNIVLYCAEFNGRVQWSKEKFNNLLNLHYMPIK